MSIKSKGSRIIKKALTIFRRKKPAVVVAILGTVEPILDKGGDGWMLTDYLLWYLILLYSTAVDLARSSFYAPRDFASCVPSDGKVIIGEPGNDRMAFTAKTNFRTRKTTIDSVKMTVSDFMVDVRDAAKRLIEGEILVILLVGHGGQGKFWVSLPGQPREQIPKHDLEAAVAGTCGNVVLISTACYSGTFASDHWTLVCAAGPEEASESLTQSISHRFRGSIFTLSTLAELFRRVGLRIPAPPRTLVLLDSDTSEAPNHDIGTKQPNFNLDKWSLRGFLNGMSEFINTKLEFYHPPYSYAKDDTAMDSLFANPMSKRFYNLFIVTQEAKLPPSGSSHLATAESSQSMLQQSSRLNPENSPIAPVDEKTRLLQLASLEAKDPCPSGLPTDQWCYIASKSIISGAELEELDQVKLVELLSERELHRRMFRKLAVELRLCDGRTESLMTLLMVVEQDYPTVTSDKVTTVLNRLLDFTEEVVYGPIRYQRPIIWFLDRYREAGSPSIEDYAWNQAVKRVLHDEEGIEGVVRCEW